MLTSVQCFERKYTLIYISKFFMAKSSDMGNVNLCYAFALGLEKNGSYSDFPATYDVRQASLESCFRGREKAKLVVMDSSAIILIWQKWIQNVPIGGTPCFPPMEDISLIEFHHDFIVAMMRLKLQFIRFILLIFEMNVSSR